MATDDDDDDDDDDFDFDVDSLAPSSLRQAAHAARGSRLAALRLGCAAKSLLGSEGPG